MTKYKFWKKDIKVFKRIVGGGKSFPKGSRDSIPPLAPEIIHGEFGAIELC